MHSFRTIVEGEIRARGEALSFAHAMLMMSLAREPGLSGAQVARRQQVTAQTMNVLLRNLESAGFAVREPNPENRRADRWFLTHDGLRHLEQGRLIADEVMRKMLVPLTDEGRRPPVRAAAAMRAGAARDSGREERRRLTLRRGRA